ncbi:hypothetical protein M885DRAFT_520220 [Pelagophyceae sp. CCMP2097]|nr:hypothetical protein M885DRAFT_520220 [Pelagophyceae sp. CCMP2097]|mmetsp:Transcript_15893/g.53561  ORF Transcript_15893/g.53561 Transcript_15893/m.53561 type:complete len:169 (-) Transcript_15893:24-530(-)
MPSMAWSLVWLAAAASAFSSGGLKARRPSSALGMLNDRERIATVPFSGGCKASAMTSFVKMWLAGRAGWRLVGEECIAAAMEEDGSKQIMGDVKVSALANSLVIDSSGGNFLYDLREASLVGALLTELWEIWGEVEEAGVEPQKRLFLFANDDVEQFAELRRRFAETI